MKIHAPDTPEIRDRYSIAGLPTVIVAKPNGEEIDRTLGFIRTGTFIDTVEGYHEGIGTLESMMAKESEMSSDLDFVYALGNKLYERRRWDDADERYAAIIKRDSANMADMAAKAQLQRAIVAGRQDKFMLANAFCSALIEKWPQSERVQDATIYMGYFAQKDGREEDAVAAYKQYLERWPDGEDAEFAQKEIKEIESPEESDE